MAAPAAEREQDVIVLLKDQRPDLPARRGARRARPAALRASQEPVVADLQRARTHQVKSFGLVNAFATRLTDTEVQSLKAHPLVQAVVPDAVIKQRARVKDHHKGGAAGGPAPASTSTPSSPLCGTLEPEALQLTHTAFLDPTVPQAQETLDGKGVKVTGVGVKVAFLADGIDPQNAGFIRPDGSSVFVDYQDFSGDPAGTPTAGAEAFGDASSIAAQDMPHGAPLLFDISTFVSAARPLPSPCNIRIRGMAPGASLVGLKVYSQLGYTTTSTFVQAIEYAVIEDDVDVINESFGSNFYPDSANDPISLVNDAAVAAGVTVTVSTGDAGTAGTLGSPATTPSVIAAGASTQFRLYAQTGSGANWLASGYVSDNVSSLSSAGFSQKSARTVDVLGPGDNGWALCSLNPLFGDCQEASYTLAPAAIQAFGGTSEGAPLTAGVAALVIQAYRSTHHGADPTPALIKQIIMGSATDLGAPSDEQGAGRIDGLAAVQMALSLPDGHGGAGAGHGLLASPSSARLTAQAGQGQALAVVVTNTGATTQHLAPALETLGAPIAGQSLTLLLDPTTDPILINALGDPRSYVEETFTVPAGADHLDASIALPPVSAFGQTIPFLSLLDPSGRQIAYSSPQGLGSGYAHVDVVKPAAGQWKAVVFARPDGVGSYAGPIAFSWSAERYVSLGAVFPSHLTLAPGESAEVAALFDAPSQPGDLAAGIRFHDATSGASISEVPVTVRILVPTGPTGGSFAATLTGGNGRPYGYPTQTFEFVVPPGAPAVSVSVSIADPGYGLIGYLVDPNGMVLSNSGNTDVNGVPQGALRLSHVAPQPGIWRFELEEITPSGAQTSIVAAGQISFAAAPVTAAGLPTHVHGTLSAAAGPVTVPVVVTNIGGLTRNYFVDARLDGTTTMSLPTSACGVTTTLPSPCSGAFVPPRTTAVQFGAQSSVPITMDVLGVFGAPDVWAGRVGPNSVLATVAAPEVGWGYWTLEPALIGPFGPAGAPTEPLTTTATATLQAFDPSVSSDSGDLWSDLTLGTFTYAPLVLAPGETGIIHVTITPDPSRIGSKVSGTLYVDTNNFYDMYGTGDEVAGLPYAYTIAP